LSGQFGAEKYENLFEIVFYFENFFVVTNSNSSVFSLLTSHPATVAELTGKLPSSSSHLRCVVVVVEPSSTPIKESISRCLQSTSVPLISVEKTLKLKESPYMKKLCWK
jgi:hypothetical protein